MTKRIVVQCATGIRRIIGTMDIPADAVFQQHFDDVTFAGHTGSIDFVKEAPKYVLYREAESA